MKDKLKKITILLIILLIICTVILFVISKKNNLKTADYSNDSIRVEESIKSETNNIIEYEKNKNIYYTIVSIITKYIDSAAINDRSVLLNMLDSEYITKYNINEDNINEITGINPLENDFQYYIFNPNTIYSVDEGKITTHFVYGYYYNISDMNKKNISLMIQLDTVNQTFNIYNHKYIVDNNYNNLKIGDLYNANIDEIENRDDNTFTYINMSDEDMSNKYLQNYKYLILYDKAKACEILDEEYAKLKFKDQAEFDNFAESKKTEIFKAQLDKYTVEYAQNGNKMYLCTDQYGNYYSFEETDGIMQYKVILDSYTIVNDKFIEKYSNATEQQKVALNIDKFMQAINNKDYKYAYNCLAGSFKNNYFKTQADFENYAKENFYSSNTVGYNQFDTQGEYYTYSIILTNKETKETMNKTFIMQLGEGTDFKLSFNR